VLLLTETPTPAEREAALAVVPWHDALRKLAGEVAGVMRNRSIDLIDIALGEGSHGREALVALQEGVDSLLQATVDVAESAVREQTLARVAPLDPLKLGEALLPPENPERMRWRVARTGIEDAAVRAVAGVDHLANAHVRIAWEANAASEAEVKTCGFDPSRDEPNRWTSLPGVAEGIQKLKEQPLGVLIGFAANAGPHGLEQLADESEVQWLREFRNAVVHRARPSYQEAPSFGRLSLLAQPDFKITIQAQPEPPDPALPTIADVRTRVAAGIEPAVPYAHLLWDLAVRWLRAIGVSVTRPREGEVRVTTEHWGSREPRYPRAQRDPGPFLVP
jgi:hypothetical protein